MSHDSFMSHDPLTLQFANQTVSITIPLNSDNCLPQHLRRHFAGCLAEKKGGATAVFHLKMPQAKQWQLWQDETLHLEVEAVAYLLEPLMQAVVEQLITPAAQHLLFHAGGVALADQGVLICGPSGSGKSTLTARLIQSGFGYLSDEVVALPLSLDAMNGLSRSLVLKAGSDFIWRSQPTSNEVLPLPGGLAWVTPAYLGGELCQQAMPRLLLFPQFEAGTELAINRLSAGEAAFALLQNLANARNLPDQGFRLTAELARNVPAYRVVFNDETAVISWLHNQLSEQ